MEKMPITREGFEKLKKDLEFLRKVAVPENVRAIEDARSHGDISENAEFAAAKERQSFLQGKIQDIENTLATSKIIETNGLAGDRVVFGATVSIDDVNTGESTSYRLVGPSESDVGSNRISVTSPIGKALIGKKVGDLVKVKTPRGMRELEITDISGEESG